MAWRNRTSLPVLLEHFPSLKEDGEGKMVGWCPCQHPEGVPTPFLVYLMEGGLWAIDFCEFGDSPTEIWEASKKPDREPGIDDGAKPGLERFAYTPGVVEMRADPPPREYLLKVARTGAGVLKLGEVFMLAGTGGMGKSNALMQLDIAVATGTNWFGAGRGWAARHGRVLSLFGEESLDEVKRRLHFAIKASGLTSDEDMQTIADNLVLMAMRGEDVVLCGTMDKSGTVTVTERAIELLDYLKLANSQGRPFLLVSFDPLSRFGGGDVETNNSAATKFIGICERLTKPDCGSPSLGMTHHLRKTGIGGEPDDLGDAIRGASALKNGVRWTGVMKPAKKDAGYAVKLSVPKNNHGPPTDSLSLAYLQGCEGMLIAIEPPARGTAADANGEDARDYELEHRILASIEKRGPGSGKELAERLSRRQTAVGKALHVMHEAGTLIKVGRYSFDVAKPTDSRAPLSLFPKEGK